MTKMATLIGSALIIVLTVFATPAPAQYGGIIEGTAENGPTTLWNVEHSDEPTLAVTPRTALECRMARGNTGRSHVDRVCVFRVQGSLKLGLRSFLSSRAGLTRETIYPSAFDRPHLEQFAINHGRGSKIP